MRSLLLVFLQVGFLLSCSQDQNTTGGTSDQPLSSIEQAAESGTNAIAASRIDTIISRRFPLLPHGKDAAVMFEVTGIDWASSVQWRVTVSANGSTLYERAGSSEKFDGVFSDPALMPGCTEPVDCKQNWFLNEWPNWVRFDSLEAVGERREMFDSIMPGLVQESLDEYGYSEDESHALARDFVSFYNGKEIPMIEFMFDPISDTSWLLAYHPAVQRLVVAFAP